jgi:hypothetical protein
LAVAVEVTSSCDLHSSGRGRKARRSRMSRSEPHRSLAGALLLPKTRSTC